MERSRSPSWNSPLFIILLLLFHQVAPCERITVTGHNNVAGNYALRGDAFDRPVFRRLSTSKPLFIYFQRNNVASEGAWWIGEAQGSVASALAFSTSWAFSPLLLDHTNWTNADWRAVSVHSTVFPPADVPFPCDFRYIHRDWQTKRQRTRVSPRRKRTIARLCGTVV